MAAGKSSLASIFKELGAQIIDADELARRVVAKGSKTLEKIVAEFGPEIIGPGGDLNRSALAEIVFADSSKRLALEQITHPEIKKLARQEHQKLSDTSPFKHTCSIRVSIVLRKRYAV